ncbi:MAG: hydrogenase maturation nickel metallochaperone HypA [Burkholderiales bacterium]|nr:hydrogenase maturation nickel metallochaperone HypA [Burkholderiales bacterium]MDE1929731.1 hydrogenase maturation nickel metallochaperone HypA [Burkholderiales bacterium]MDE2161473.1 hydrogenase maturation nickel metallochaperone HypA [Burkholderiales bacterium]MDE2504637.1 hydrogenase maturation nickel metallochaperone HypA [Burkholderiales bacterium]
MHELSLAESMRTIVLDAARAHGARSVAAVRVGIGALACVEPEALRFAFDIVKRDSIAAAARLEVERVPARARCLACACAVEVASRADLCPRCGSGRIQIDGGADLRILDIEIA